MLVSYNKVPHINLHQEICIEYYNKDSSRRFLFHHNGTLPKALFKDLVQIVLPVGGSLKPVQRVSD